jgi:hypothetical protein
VDDVTLSRSVLSMSLSSWPLLRGPPAILLTPPPLERVVTDSVPYPSLTGVPAESRILRSR